MSGSVEDIQPILSPIELPKTAEHDYALWFILSDITDSEGNRSNDGEKTSKSSKFKSWVTSNTPNATYGDSGDLVVVPISMSNDELKNHFATDEKSGGYLSTVKAPSGGRQAWLKQRYDEQQPKARKIREVSGYATKAGGVTAGGMAGVSSGGGL